jgi:hypothetical protein
MIKVKIKVKFENKTISENISFPEEYNFSKQNPDFLNLISQKCKESGFEKPDEVTANIYMEL